MTNIPKARIPQTNLGKWRVESRLRALRDQGVERVLSLKQPWLYAVTNLGKPVENRRWPAPDWIIGQTIALHASKTDDKAGYEAIYRIDQTTVLPDFLDRQCIVATAKVVEVVTEHDSPWFFGPYGWVLDEVKTLDDWIPIKGHLGLWRLPVEVEL